MANELVDLFLLLVLLLLYLTISLPEISLFKIAFCERFSLFVNILLFLPGNTLLLVFTTLMGSNVSVIFKKPFPWEFLLKSSIFNTKYFGP